MYGLIRLDAAAPLTLEAMGLCVDQMSFYIPKAVGTLIASAFDAPEMNLLPRDSGRQWHDVS
jgi:hypothetical protein